MGHVFYEKRLDTQLGATMRVEFTTKGRSVRGYSVVLLSNAAGRTETIRLYDAAHRFNEMHRYRQGDGKQRGVPFHPGSLGEGMRAAVKAVEGGYRAMIERWRTSD